MERSRLISGIAGKGRQVCTNPQGDVDNPPIFTQNAQFMEPAITAYPETLEWLAEIVATMGLDASSLRRPLRRCDLSQCQGTCCHDGVYLGPEEATVLREVVAEAREDFAEMGIVLPSRAVVYGTWRETTAGPKTAVRGVPRHGFVAEYPAHFPETACVFLLADFRCALQVLATERGLPPWFYKPLTCWMHPLALDGVEEGSPVLVLHDETNDPQRFPDYDGFVCRTPCGQSCEGGAPAWKVLEEELRFLGDLGGRDLIAEIAGGEARSANEA